MKTFLLCLSLIASSQVMAVTPIEPNPPKRFEPFDIIDLSEAHPTNIATGCGTQSRPKADHNNSSEDNILFSIMLAARESGVEVELVEEDICLN